MKFSIVFAAAALAATLGVSAHAADQSDMLNRLDRAITNDNRGDASRDRRDERPHDGYGSSNADRRDDRGRGSDDRRYTDEQRRRDADQADRRRELDRNDRR